MVTPFVCSFPIRHPNFIQDVGWIGQPTDEELQLLLTYPNAEGQIASLALNARNGANATLCLPTSATVEDVPDDVFIAHLRMAGLIRSIIPGSSEYTDALVNAKEFNTPVGPTKIISLAIISERFVDVEFQQVGVATPTKTVRAGLVDLAAYTFVPETQLLCVPGAIRKQFSDYVQDPDNEVYLTQDQLDDIAAYVLTLAPWI